MSTAEKLYYRFDGYLPGKGGNAIKVTAIDEYGRSVAIYTGYERKSGYDLYVQKYLSYKTLPSKVLVSFREVVSQETIDRWRCEAKANNDAQGN